MVRTTHAKSSAQITMKDIEVSVHYLKCQNVHISRLSNLQLV